MPPATCLGNAIGTYATGDLTFVAPLAIAGEVLLVIIAGPSAISTTAPSGWELLATRNATSPASRTSIYRRVVTDEEPVVYIFPLGAATPSPCGILLRYRDVDGGKPLVAQSQQARATASIAHTPPTVSAVNYSDLMLLVYYGLDAAGTATLSPPGGTTKLSTEAHGPVGGGSLAVCELLLESATAIGTRTGNWSTSVTGLAACYGIESSPLHFAKPLQGIAGGAIGLPVVGI